MEESTEGWKLECPGIAFSNSDNVPFELPHDQDLLEAKIDLKIGEEKTKMITFSEDRLKAYVELSDHEDIEKLLSVKIALAKRKSVLVIERIDLMDIRQYYLTVKGLEDWITEDLVREHFEAEANGENVESVVMMKDGTAVIKFARPKVALKFKSMGEVEMLAITVTLEVTEDISGEKKGEENELVLSVKNLHLIKIPPERMQTSLEKYIVKHTGKKIQTCVINGGIGYIAFEDPSVVSSIVANPPTAAFFANVQLEYCTSLRSKVEALCCPPPNMEIASLTSSVSSSLFQSNYIRNPSMESASSIDPSTSINWTGFRQRNPSSISSEVFSEVNGHLPNQSLSSSVVQEQHHVPVGTTPEKPQPMYIQDLENLPDERHQRPPSAGVHFNVRDDQNISHLASLPTQGLASTPSQRINQQQWQDQDNVLMSLPSPGRSTKTDLQLSATEMMETFVLVGNVPTPKRNERLISLYLSSLMNVRCSVKQHGERFLATFEGVIDLRVLEQKQKAANEVPMLQFTFTEIQDSKRLLVDQISDTFSEGYLKLHFEAVAGRGTVELVEKVSPNRALITFRSPSCRKKAMCSTQCWKIEDVYLNMAEYYDFMSMDDEDGDNQLEDSAKHMEILDEIQFDLQPLQIHWLQVTLNELNSRLSPFKARCSVNKNTSTDIPVVLISPQSDAETVVNWEVEVRAVMEKYLSCFTELEFKFPMNLKLDIVSRIQQRNDINFQWNIIDGGVILYGQKSTVNDLISDLKYFIEEVQVDREEKKFRKGHIKLLSLQCKHKLNMDQVEEYQLSQDTGKVIVRGTSLGRKNFWKVIEYETNNLIEKKLELSPELFDFLHTLKGINKIKELMGMSVSTIVYCLEKGADDTSYIYFLCHSIAGDSRAKAIKHSFKSYLGYAVVPVESSKFRFCRDVKWNRLVDMLEQQSFVSIVLDQPSNLIKVCGEKIAVNDICETLEQHLLDISSVEEHLEIDYFKWKIMFNDLKHKVEAILQDFGKNIKIISPSKVDDLQCKPVSITLQGDPNAVDDAKVRLKSLEKEVCHIQEKLGNIPAAHRLVHRMEDKINVLEHTYNACIDVKFVGDDIPSQSKSSTTKSYHPTKIGGAILSSEVRVSVYSDNFTKHSHVHTIINFVQDHPGDADINLKLIFETSNGSVLRNEFHNKIDKAVYLSSGSLLRMDTADGLECNELYYAVIPCWAGGNKNEGYYLEQCLQAIHSEINPSSNILLTSICSKPLLYPASVFAKKVVSCFSSLSFSDLTVAVYISSASDADEFYKVFNNPKTRCRSALLASQPQPKVSGKTINNPINTFITLVKGNLLNQQADVYICSTNTNLELKNAAVSKALLDASGEELQKECSQHAPLNVGEVAVTGAKNLKSDFIFYVVLPDHTDQRSERKFRTAMQTILRTAKGKAVTSVAIPSLGIGNLHFPVSVSARIIYEEIINFNGQNPGSPIKFILVIFDQKHFNEFSKIHAQKMGSGATKKVPGQGGNGGKTQSTILSIENLNISDEKSDVIVNTTTENMGLSDSAVSKALLQKAGASLQHACDELVKDGFRLDHGQIVESKSYGSLKCRKLIHAHVPLRSDALKASIDHFSLIHDIVLKCLEKAEHLKMKSISFPAFGFGQGGYSVGEVACPMLTAMQEFGKEPHKSVEIIRIVIYDQVLYKQFYDFFLSFFNVSGSLPSRILNSITSMMTGGNQGRCVDLQDSSPTGSLPPALKSASSNSMPSSGIVFNVYASTEAKCKEIAEQLRQLTREIYKAEPIVNDVVRSLIDRDIELIQTIEKDCQVSIKVERKINQIIVQGERSEVSEAKGRINEMLNKIEKDVQLELHQYEWYTCSEGDDDREEYSHQDSFMLERARQSGVQAIELIIDNMEVIVNLQSDPMQERSKGTGVVRTVKRTKKKQPIDLPDNWVDQPDDADGKPLAVHRVEIKEGTTEYQDALKRFHETIGSQVTILKLERIQNPDQYSLHVTFKDGIARKHGKNIDEVMQLFHGLKEASVDPVMTTGFNRSFAAKANAAYYGVGVYFALNASYSAQNNYAVPNKDKVQFMFICSVVIGKYTKGNKGMLAPPPLQQGANLLYDTLVENVDNPTIYVAVKDAQAYPDYLVSFKKE